MIVWTLIADFRGEVVRVDGLSNFGVMLEAIAHINGSARMVAINDRGFYRTLINRGGDNSAIMYCSECNAITNTIAGIQSDGYAAYDRCDHRQPAVVRRERKPYTYKNRS